MSVTQDFDRSKNILRMTVSGPFSLEIFSNALKSITSSQEFPPDVCTLWDLREVDFPASSHIKAMDLLEIKNRFPERGSARLAFVVGNELGFGLTRMYESLASDLPQSTMVFYTLDEAETWLCLEE